MGRRWPWLLACRPHSSRLFLVGIVCVTLSYLLVTDTTFLWKTSSAVYRQAVPLLTGAGGAAKGIIRIDPSATASREPPREAANGRSGVGRVWHGEPVPGEGAPSCPAFVKRCQAERVGVTAGTGRPFNMSAQTLANGSRPLQCWGCFNSSFPALLPNCGVCRPGDGGEGVRLVMVILTTHGARDKRAAIRDTWASATRNNTADVRHVFLLGTVKDQKAMRKTRVEAATYGDIAVYDFVDSYSNLTLKTLTAMHWVTEFCCNTKSVLKVDDDMWINVPGVLRALREKGPALHTAVGGSCRHKAKPIRAPRSKWYVSHNAYQQSTYPGFCSGTAYVISLNVVRHVLSVSPDVPFFYLEDVYVSLCVWRLGAPFRLLSLPGFLRGRSSPCVLRQPGTVSVHRVSPARLHTIWDAKCPSKSTKPTP